MKEDREKKKAMKTRKNNKAIPTEYESSEMGEKNERTRILPFLFCTAFGIPIYIILYEYTQHTHITIYIMYIYFFSSVFHFHTMMSETQILAAVVLNTNDYKSPFILLLLRPLN